MLKILAFLHYASSHCFVDDTWTLLAHSKLYFPQGYADFALVDTFNYGSINLSLCAPAVTSSLLQRALWLPAGAAPGQCRKIKHWYGRLKEALDFMGAERESSLESGKSVCLGPHCLSSQRSPATCLQLDNWKEGNHVELGKSTRVRLVRSQLGSSSQQLVRQLGSTCVDSRRKELHATSSSASFPHL